MKKFIFILATFLFFVQSAYSLDFTLFSKDSVSKSEKEVEKLLKSQVKFANKENFDKFISTYDSNYKNSDGFDLQVYSDLIKEIWNNYEHIKYSIAIEDIKINGNEAVVKLKEYSYAVIPVNKAYDGELKSEADSVYYLKKINNKWKVVSDSVIDETTTMLYGDAKNLDISLTCPNKIKANTEYTATLEFKPPKDTVAIASIASDIVEYPQKQTKEVFRAMPEDNILERLFTSNNQNANEYIVASIGLTKTSMCDLNIRLSLTGFGYKIKRVNVLQEK